jgi:primosomal protein N'
VLTIRATTGGEGYAQRHLRQSDYYDQSRTVEGKWHGRGAELLGLKGEVTSEDFEAVRQGLDPQTGEFLRQRHGSDRIASNGEEQSKARSLYDMTFSAPKSVSVMAIAGGDERLVAAHETAVREALEEAERYSATRVRLAGLNENRATENWIVASYTRERDMIAVVQQGVDRYDRLGKGRDFELSDHLRPEQRRAVEAVLDSRDLAINIRGAAGTGKTATLREIDRGLREAGHDVLAVAPTRSAVDELEKVGFRDAMTVSRLLEHQEPQSVRAGGS